MTYTLTVNTDNPQELATLLSSLQSSKSIKPGAVKQATTSIAQEGTSISDNPKVTKEMVRELTAEKVQNGKSAVVKELLKKYNAKNAATVPEESFADFYNDLKAA